LPGACSGASIGSGDGVLSCDDFVERMRAHR
jgi:hypothetical protein